MPRQRQRVRLEDSLKLDLNKLVRRGFVQPGGMTGPVGIRWTHGYWGDLGTGLIWANIRAT
jgi:hypothetical protein